MPKRTRLKRKGSKPRKDRLTKLSPEIRKEVERTQIKIIAGISGHPMSGLWELYFTDGSSVHIESGFGVRTLAAAFGAREGTGDLMEKIKGQKIAFIENEFGVLEIFTPYAEWKEMLAEHGVD